MKVRRTLIIVLGRPKSGKGTRVDAIKKKYPSIPVIGVGDVCRDQKEKGTDLAASAARHMKEKGTTLWPTTELFLAVGQQFEEKFAKATVVVVDGLLRKPDQVSRIISLAHEHGFDRIVLLYVDTPAQDCLDRPDRGGRDDEGEIMRRMGDFDKETLPAMTKMMTEHPEIVDVITLNGNCTFEELERQVTSVCSIYASSDELGLAA